MGGTVTVKIRLVRPFRAYSTGFVLEVPTGQAKEMIQRGYAVEEKQRDLIETAALEPVVERADATPKRRGGRR